MSLYRSDRGAGSFSNPDEGLIVAAVNKFFEGIRSLDAELIKSAFHPDSKSYSVTPRGVCVEPFDAWDDLIGQAAGDPTHLFRQECTARVVAVDIEGTAASVKAEWRFGETKVTDFYSMLKTETGWLIVGQVYSVSRRNG